nr:SD12744p [Drosophila melanogaster]
MPSYPLTTKATNGGGGSTGRSPSKQLPVCTTSKNCLNPKEHFLPNDTSLDDDYLSECENCKIAQSAKYFLDAEMSGGGSANSHQETMTLQRKSLEETKEEPMESYYRSSHTLPSNAKKHGKNNNREKWQVSTIPAASSSDEDINE